MTSAPAAARALGVSLPTMHSLLDAHAVPRTRRGVPRPVPGPVFEAIKRERGVTPKSDLLVPSAMRILAALMMAPFGYPSARRVADAAGVSPTTASRQLHRLMDAGVVSHAVRRVARGRAIDQAEYRIVNSNPVWQSLAPLVRSVEPAARETPRPEDRIPRRFWHLFWNTEPSALRMKRDGGYVARRLLTSDDASAQKWALAHASASDLRFAVSGRGADARTKALVENWLAR